MILTLVLAPELEQNLLQQANQRGLSVEALALQLLVNSILLKHKQSEAVNLIQSWIEDEDGKGGTARNRSVFDSCLR